MKTTFALNPIQQPIQKIAKRTAVITFALFLAIPSALAEAPIVEPGITQQNNIRRLMVTNACEGCDLSGATLANAHLIGADLRNANLQWADLTNANLEGVDLGGANLTGANLTGAFLTDAYLANTQLISVNFADAHLYNTNVTGATVENVNLAGAEVFNTPISVGGEAPVDGKPAFEPKVPTDTEPPVLKPAVPYY